MIPSPSEHLKKIVKAKFRSLTPEERWAWIEAVREELGLSTPALQRLEDLFLRSEARR